MQGHERCDVAIMGAGAAGALIAARLAAAGKSVVVLEAGPPWTQGDLVSSQIWARRLKWAGAPVLPGGSDPVGYNYNGGTGLGGGALHHYASWPRLHPADFTMRSDLGSGLDWPIGYHDLRPHYDRVQEEVGMSGDAMREVWRPPGKAYEMPPVQTFRQAEVLAKGFAARDMRVAPMPFGIATREYKGRAACLYDGWCDAGCPIGALANPLALHLPNARAAGAEFRTGAAVTRIDVKNGRADALHYLDALGEAHVQPATTIVLAGASVQNVRLLLASQVRDPSGLTGAYFNTHSFGNVHGLFAEDTECHRGLAAGGMMSQDDYAKQRSGGPTGSITWGFAPALKPNDLIGIAMTRVDLFGLPLDAFMRRASRHMGMINGIVENLPERANRIELARERDAHGMPLARIVHSVQPNGRALFARMVETGTAIVKAAGALEVWPSPRPQTAHLLGGTIMGKNAADSVVDSHGRMHAVPNLFVAGAGQFPTIGAVSPTFTVLALADRAVGAMLG